MQVTLADLGEKQVIRRLIRSLRSANDTPLPLNDDAQLVLNPGDGVPIVITTDRTPSDLRARKWGLMSNFEYGAYCVGSNISDIAAMGCAPLGFLLNLAAPARLEVSCLQEVLQGVDQALMRLGIKLLGGDTKEGSDLSLVGIALGYRKSARVLTRSGVKPGDYVGVSAGHIGLTPAAFRYFGNEWLKDDLSLLPFEQTLRLSLVEVTPRISEGLALAADENCTACIDNSDGIYSSATELAEASNVRIILDLSMLEPHPAVNAVAQLTEQRWEALALGAGADYKLIATFSSWPPSTPGFQCIGHVVKGAGVVVECLTLEQQLGLSGWTHFKEN